ncbi:acyl-CoA N-acyltransferase [Camillea tinctor]|nr:acyl-CoA N-acyltransferase [Camillea tinctor]
MMTVGYWVGSAYRGLGIGGSAARALSRWAFSAEAEKKLGARLLRVEAWVFGGNTASEGVLRKAGFVWEGARRAAVVKDGVVLDEVLYGLTRSDVEAEGTEVKEEKMEKILTTKSVSCLNDTQQSQV